MKVLAHHIEANLPASRFAAYRLPNIVMENVRETIGENPTDRPRERPGPNDCAVQSVAHDVPGCRLPSVIRRNDIPSL